MQSLFGKAGVPERSPHTPPRIQNNTTLAAASFFFRGFFAIIFSSFVPVGILGGVWGERYGTPAFECVHMLLEVVRPYASVWHRSTTDVFDAVLHLWVAFWEA